MVRRIILFLLLFILVALLIMWIIGGGPRALLESTRTAVSTVSDTTSLEDQSKLRLPWQPPQLFPTFDISHLLNMPAEEYDASTDFDTDLAEIEAEYERISREAGDVRTFGVPSTYRGQVKISRSQPGISASEVHQEYIELYADFNNKASIDMTGWYVESALSGTRIMLTQAASPFIMGAPSPLSNIVLAPGTTLTISSGSSPVGMSFRENSCVGYLTQFQEFTPDISYECPDPHDVMPLTTDNLLLYGETCFDALDTLDQCRFPQGLPSNITNACRSFLTNSFSYNGCVSRERNRSSFPLNSWRIYLDSRMGLWRDSHDAIRLLDASGKTVDLYVY